MDVLEAKGRHDPCVLPRCPPLFEGRVVSCRVVSCRVVSCRVVAWIGLSCGRFYLDLSLSGLDRVLVGLLVFQGMAALVLADAVMLQRARGSHVSCPVLSCPVSSRLFLVSS